MDTGKGIPAEKLPCRLDGFYWHISRAGLENAIIQQMIHVGGGRMNVRSEVGHGTTPRIHRTLAQK